MTAPDSVATSNEKAWDALVEAKQSFTVPWLDLDPILLRRYAAGELRADSRFEYVHPWRLFSEIEGKRVLCLASGGGQQSAVFGLLGAKVTVVDLSEGQLRGDRRAAEHYGYEITPSRLT